MFLSSISDELQERIRRWPGLKRWERREIGQELRRMGLSYKEIAAVIPVSNGTLSGWCRDITLTQEQEARLMALQPQTSVGPILRARNDARTGAIRRASHKEALRRLADPFWVAGVTLYWAEGSKRTNHVAFSNSDPAMVQLFVTWAARYLDLDLTRFTAALHLHTGQDESERKEFWCRTTGIPVDAFRKTFIKPEGTGHRKNVLYHGTIKVRITRSADLLHRILGWIDGVAEGLAVVR